VVLEKDEVDLLDWLCEKGRSIMDSQEEQVYPTNNKKGMLTGLVTYYVRTAY